MRLFFIFQIMSVIENSSFTFLVYSMCDVLEVLL